MQEDIVMTSGERITEVIAATLTDRLGGELVLDFRTAMKRHSAPKVGDRLTFLSQVFTITAVNRSISNGAFLMDISAEHASFSLADEEFDLDGFNYSGTASGALLRILSGTEFNGTVDSAVNSSVAFEREGTVNRRTLLNDLCGMIGGELIYDGYGIRIAAHRGSTHRYVINREYAVSDFSVSERGDGVSYEMVTDGLGGISVGDDVTISLTDPFSVQADVRVIGIRYNPFYRKSVVIEMGDYRPDITDEMVDDREETENIRDSLKDYVTQDVIESSVDTYINSENGKASLIHSLSGTYVTTDEATGFVERTELSAEIAAYVDSAAGTAKITQNLSGTFVKEDALGNYVEKTELNTSIESYIDTEAGTAKIVSAASGTFQKKSDMGSYVTATTLNTSISQYLDTTTGQAQIVSAASGTFQKKSDMTGYVTTTNLNTSIGQYIDSTTGKAKVVSAVSGTYQTISGMSDYAKASAVTTISQDVSDVEAAITLSSSYTKNTIGTNVYALLQLVSNANSSSIKIKADKIDFTGFTTFLRASDLGSSGSTTIDGGRITTGTISADRIDVSNLKVNTIYGKGSYSSYTAMTTDSTNLYVGGGSFTPSYTNVYLAAKTKVYFGSTGIFEICVDVANYSIYSAFTESLCGTSSNPWGEIHGGGSRSYHIIIDDTVIRPSASSTSVSNSLGTSTYPWNAVYTKKLYLNGTEFSDGSSFAGSQVTMGGSSSYYIVADTNRALRPSSASTTYEFRLGTVDYYWHYAYIGSTASYIGKTTSSKLGFFGTTPVARQTVSSSATVATLITALKAYGLIG